MKNNYGFTFVEIIVVLSIMLLISFASIGQFNNFLSTNYLEVNTQEISSVIQDLDTSVKNGKIYDYTMYFSSWSWFTYSVNNYWPYIISFIPKTDYFWYSWTVISNSTNTWIILTLKTFDGEKMDKSITYVSTWVYDVWFWKTTKYSFLSDFSWVSGNSMFLKFYSVDNIASQKIIEKRLILEAINTKEDMTWISFTWIILKNVNNKKTLILSWSTEEYNEIFLLFDRNDTKKTLHITTN